LFPRRRWPPGSLCGIVSFCLLLLDETVVDDGDRLFKVFVFHTDDDVDLIASLCDHANVDVVVSQCRKQTAADARTGAHIASDGRDERDLIGYLDMIRMALPADVLDDIVDDVLAIAGRDDDAERVDAAGNMFD